MIRRLALTALLFGFSMAASTAYTWAYIARCN